MKPLFNRFYEEHVKPLVIRVRNIQCISNDVQGITYIIYRESNLV